MTAMSNQLTIQAGLPIHGPADSPVPPRQTTPASAPVHSPTAAHTVAPAAQTASVVKPVALFANPSYRFDPTTGFVVIEFHDGKGAISNSIPTQRQLQAYRTHQEVPPGEPTSTPANGKTAAG
jgi:hypothetical protein